MDQFLIDVVQGESYSPQVRSDALLDFGLSMKVASLKLRVAGVGSGFSPNQIRSKQLKSSELNLTLDRPAIND